MYVMAEAHMFWWLYRSPQRVDNGITPWPTVLWLQGGPVSSSSRLNFSFTPPLKGNHIKSWLACLYSVDCMQGASGVGYGNFVEIGPLDTDLKPRAYTWLAKADLLFVVTTSTSW